VGADGFTFNSPTPLTSGGTVGFTGLSLQQYTVTVTSVNGCQSTQQITLTGTSGGSSSGPPPPPPPPTFAITVSDVGDQD